MEQCGGAGRHRHHDANVLPRADMDEPGTVAAHLPASRRTTLKEEAIMNHVHITGAVDANGGFTPGWWYTPPPEAVSAAQAYPDSYTVWEAVALDDADDILARAPAPLFTVQVCPGEPYFRLDAMLGLPDTTSSVAIIDGD